MQGKQFIIPMAILLAALVAINRIEEPVPVGGEEELQDVQGLLERANRQSKDMRVPRFHDREAEKAAKETANIYHSRKYQARLQEEISRLKARVFPGAMAQANNVSNAKSAEKTFLLPDERIYLFISSSMPVSTLRNYAADLGKLKDPT